MPKNTKVNFSTEKTNEMKARGTKMVYTSTFDGYICFFVGDRICASGSCDWRLCKVESRNLDTDLKHEQINTSFEVRDVPE